MRLALLLPAAATASLIAVCAAAVASGSYNPQYIVLSTRGQVVDVDPQLYFPLADSEDVEVTTIPSTFKRKHQQRIEPTAVTDDIISECGSDLSPVEEQSVALTDTLSSDPSTGFCHQQETPKSVAEECELSVPPGQVAVDEDEFAHLPMVLEFSHEELHGIVQPLSDYLDSELPGVQGSILFAELSCLFVAFIGYLVCTIPLWSTFSKSQKGCLIVAFSSAFMYQFAAVSWYWSLVSPELMVGLSSLITRMISLGMVPITTTSFIGRAREVCQESSRSSAVNTTSSSRHRRHRARSS